MIPGMVVIPNSGGFYGAPLTALWLPAVIAEGKRLGYGDVDISKVFHAYDSFSGATHSDGLGVDVVPVDVTQTLNWVILFRKRGGAAWPRGSAWGTPKYKFHIHVQVYAGIYQVAYWQIEDALAGRNGIGNGGKDIVSFRFTGIKAIDGIALTKELQMNEVQASQLANIYAAIFNGGPSMKDGGKSVSQSLAEIRAGMDMSIPPIDATLVEAIANRVVEILIRKIEAIK